MSRTPFTAFALIVALVGATTTLAAEGQRIGVFNPNRALFESPQGKAAVDKFNAERADKTKEIVSEQKDIRALEERLNRDGAIMSESERADVENRYRVKRQRLERRAAEIEEDLNQRRSELLSGIENLVMSTARQYASERGFDIILGPGVVYADKSVDITDEVVKRMAATAPQAPRAADPAKPAPSTKK